MSDTYKVDYHIHSWYSDGTMKPTELVRRYYDMEYDMISITDHDGIDGVQEALIAGVKIYFYGGGYLHSKTLVSDGTVCTVGSTNLDVRSFEQDFEINAFIYDAAVSRKLRDAFLSDMEISTRVTLEQWRKRSTWEKFKESFARLFSPIL